MPNTAKFYDTLTKNIGLSFLFMVTRPKQKKIFNSIWRETFLAFGKQDDNNLEIIEKYNIVSLLNCLKQGKYYL